MTRPRPLALAALAGALAALSPRSAAAVPVAIEIRPGAAIPLGAFPDGQPIPFDDPRGEAILRQPDSRYRVMFDLDTAAGFNIAATLLLGRFTIGAAVSVHRWSSVEPTRFAVVRYRGRDLPKIVRNLYLGAFVGARELDVSDRSPTFVVPRLTVGYRWYLTETRLRPYVPIAIGAAAIVLEGEADFGLVFRTGLGAELRLLRHLDVGLAVHYEWTGFFITEAFGEKTAARDAIAQSSAGTSATEAFIESLHTLQVAATATYRF